MDYVVGSVAALISGNVTPNRPKLIRRALTPTKHQPSPNVTPKSEVLEDRSIFLSPTLQKKKAIVKKSPKRIFQNPDLDITNDGEGPSKIASPDTNKVKKHLKEELEGNAIVKNSSGSVKSPKKTKSKHNMSVDSALSDKKVSNNDKLSQSLQVSNESTPKKNKKLRSSISVSSEGEKADKENLTIANVQAGSKTPKKGKKKLNSESSEVTVNDQVLPAVETSIITPKKKKTKATPADITSIEVTAAETSNTAPKKKKNKSADLTSTNIEKDLVNQSNTEQSPSKTKKRKLSESHTVPNNDQEVTENSTVKKKNKKRKKKSKANTEPVNSIEQLEITAEATKRKKKDKKSKVNPNAITTADTDSEHESDDEMKSDNEDSNKDILETRPPSSDDEEEEEVKEKNKEVKKKPEVEKEDDPEVVKRTLFVGNVPFSKKCKKEIKKIFNKYGHIETVRIRGVPVKDARTTPKVAVIKSELHPERTTVNLYIKFKDPDSVDKALAENNTQLNGHHLRVTRSDDSGSHDPRRAIFVGNLPFAIEDETLRGKFEGCGEIESVRIVRDKKTNVGKGFGYVNFKTKDGVELALAMTEEDLTIKNRILRVKRCTLTQNQGHKSQGQRKRDQMQRESQGPKQHGNRERLQGHGPRDQMQHGQKSWGPKTQNHPARGQSNHFNQSNKPAFKHQDGAHRRVMNKRLHEKETAGPPNKKLKQLTQPEKEKKIRKEFVGVTAEKKKKRKFDKGQKKKKAISELLSKL